MSNDDHPGTNTPPRTEQWVMPSGTPPIPQPASARPRARRRGRPVLLAVLLCIIVVIVAVLGIRQLTQIMGGQDPHHSFTSPPTVGYSGPPQARERSPPPGPRASKRPGGSPSPPHSTARAQSQPLRAPPCTPSSRTPTMPPTGPQSRPSTSYPRNRASCGTRRALFPSPSGVRLSSRWPISSSSAPSSSTRRRAPSPWLRGRGRRRSRRLTASSWRATANRRARAGRRSPPRGCAGGRQPQPANGVACPPRPCSRTPTLP